MKLDKRKSIFISFISALIFLSIVAVIFLSNGQDASAGTSIKAAKSKPEESSGSPSQESPFTEKDLVLFAGVGLKDQDFKLMTMYPDGSNLQELSTFEFPVFGRFTYSMKTMKAGGLSGSDIISLDLKTFKIQLISNNVAAARFSPECDLVLYANVDLSFKLMDIEKGTVKPLNLKESMNIGALIEGKQLIVSEIMFDQTVRVLKMSLESESFVELFSFKGTIHPILGVIDVQLDCSNDGRIIAYTSAEYKLSFYDTVTKKTLSEVDKRLAHLISPDGKYCAFKGFDDKIFVVETETGKQFEIEYEGAEPNFYSWSHDGGFLYIVTGDDQSDSRSSCALSVVRTDTMKWNKLELGEWGSFALGSIYST